MDSRGGRRGYVGGVRTLRARGWDALVLVLVVCVLFEVLTTDVDVPLALSVPVALAMTVPLLWGQRRPMPVAAIVMGAWLEPQSELLPICLVFWSLGAYASGRRAGWSLAVALGALVAHQPDDAIVMVPLMAGVFASGRLMRSREQLVRALAEERAQAERYAVAEERARIARELHDVVGHAISLMTVQAGAERLALAQAPDDQRPETGRVLGQIELTGRQTMQEMRRLLGVLRTDEDDPDLGPQPGLTQVGALAERLRGAGLAVDVRVEGDPRPLSPGADISAYRIVQEALTNVLKHAGTDRAQVRVVHGAAGVEIAVTDEGAAAREPSGRGHGLAGIRERVALYGGTLDAGPAPDGGWRLVARLPREQGS